MPHSQPSNRGINGSSIFRSMRSNIIRSMFRPATALFARSRDEHGRPVVYLGDSERACLFEPHLISLYRWSVVRLTDWKILFLLGCFLVFCIRWFFHEYLLSPDPALAAVIFIKGLPCMLRFRAPPPLPPFEGTDSVGPL